MPYPKEKFKKNVKTHACTSARTTTETICNLRYYACVTFCYKLHNLIALIAINELTNKQATRTTITRNQINGIAQ